MNRDKALYLIHKAMWVLGFEDAAKEFLIRSEFYNDFVLNEKRLDWAAAVQRRVGSKTR